MKDPCKCAPVQYLTKMINDRATVNNLQVDFEIVQSTIRTVKAGMVSPVNLKMALELAGELFKCTDLTLPFIKTKYTENPDPSLLVACGIFGYPVLTGPPVLDVKFGYEVTQANGADLINKFVETKTNGQLKQILNSEPIGTSLVSTLYFKGNWQDKFDVHQTRKDFTFKGINGEAKVDMMCKYGREKTNFIATNNFESIVLPYLGGRFVSIMTLPRDGNKSMHDLFRDRSLYEEMSSHFNLSTMRQLKVQHYVPKFKKEFSYQNMHEILQGAGFNFQEFKQRSGIDDVIHKVVVEVDEVGTTAAAATVMVSRGASSVDAHWIGDRPYTFAIMDLSDRSVLFWGLIDFSC
jgi:serine protease inhibitor